MPSPEPVVPIEQLRAAAQERVAETTLRTAAAEIGMEHSGLNKLLQGTRPRPSTVRKLTTWYLRRAAAGELDLPPEIAAAVTVLLVKHLPEREQVDTAEQILAVIRKQTVAAGLPLPDWLRP